MHVRAIGAASWAAAGKLIAASLELPDDALV